MFFSNVELYFIFVFQKYLITIVILDELNIRIEMSISRSCLVFSQIIRL